MLLHCPECGRQVSDKALFCPGCGYPMRRKQSGKRDRSKRRLPNGFGSITYLKGRHLRRPYLARVTVGKTEEGKPIVRNLKPVSYFKTYNEAYSALVTYNMNPYTFDKDLSVREALELFLTHFRTEGHSNPYVQAIERAKTRSEPLYDMRLREIKPRHLKACLESVKSDNEKATFKLFWNRVFDYAIEYELADHNYARDFKLDERNSTKTSKKPHIAFTDKELATLWDNKEDEVVRMILIQCYMGWRPNELCEITLDNVDMERRCITGGSKTEAGIDRVVPIHSKIQNMVGILVDKAEMTNRKLLFTIDSEVVDYQRYYYYFGRVVKRLGLDTKHKPHDPRKQFVTMAKRCGVDEYVIKLLVGHTISDITEAKYTDRDLEWIRSEIEKIT